MNDITTLGMVVTAERDKHSSGIKIAELQLLALTDNQVREMAKEFDTKSISTIFLTFDVTNEDDIRFLLRYTKFYTGRKEDFEKACNMVMTYADSDITEKLITMKQKGVFDSWLKGELEEGSQVSTVETFVEPDESDVETLSSLLDRINDPTLKEEVLTKFKATLQSPE